MNFRRLGDNFAKVNFVRRFDNVATYRNLASLSDPFGFSDFFEKLSRSGVFCFKILPEPAILDIGVISGD